MIEKTSEKELAIKLRREGKTYREILEVVPVAKSTLSLWLRSVDMAKKQRQRHTKARYRGSMKGGEARRKDRIDRTKIIVEQAKERVDVITERELFLIGVSLYWAEGSKEKEHRPGTGFDFINMDAKMIALVLKWLIYICKIPKDMIGFELYLHESHKNRVEEIQGYWASTTGFSIDCFKTVRYKKNKISKTKRKNVGQNYYGSLVVSVRRSSALVRMIAGSVEGIMEGIDKLIAGSSNGRTHPFEGCYLGPSPSPAASTL